MYAVSTLAELDGPVIVDLKSNCNDGLQAVVVCVIALSVRGSYEVFLNNCFLVQFAIFKDGFQMLIDG